MLRRVVTLAPADATRARGSRLAGDPALRARLGAAGRARILAEFSIDAMVDGNLAIYRHVLETLRPGQIFFWDGDGAMSHEDAMRSLKLMGEEVLPAVREMGRELELTDAFEVDPATNQAVPSTDPAVPVD